MTDVEIGLAFQKAKEALKKLEVLKVKTIKELAEELEKAGMPTEIIACEIVRALEGYVSKGYVMQCLEEKYKKFLKNLSVKPTDALPSTSEKIIEQSSKPVVIDTSGEAVDDETDEQHDQRSEQAITDQVNKSMNQPDPYKYSDQVMKKLSEEVKQYNKIMTDQAEKIEELQQKLKAAEDQTKDAEYIRLEEKLTRLEEINARLLQENKQYSEAVVKHSFESATNVKVDTQQIRNYESMIKSLEEIIATKNTQINELSAKCESFGHIDAVAEPQPLELDVHRFVGVIFANRQNKVTIVHDNKKVLNIKGGG